MATVHRRIVKNIHIQDAIGRAYALNQVESAAATFLFAHVMFSRSTCVSSFKLYIILPKCTKIQKPNMKFFFVKYF